MTAFHGTKHDDNFDRSSDTSSDTFDLYKGGNDTVIAGSGDDTFNMGTSLDAGDRLDGGAGRDVVFLHGDYSAGVTFDDQTIQNIEVLRLGRGFDYNLTLADGNVAAGETLKINAAALGAGNHLIFDGSAETDGRFVVDGSAGNDTLTGGAKADIFHLEAGGNDIAHGGGGNDTLYMGGAFTASDAIDGGAGNNTLILDGDYSGANLMISDAQVTNIENLDFLTRITGSKTTFITGDIAGGHTLDIDVALTTSNRFFLDLSGATSAAYDITTTNIILSVVTFGGNFSSADKFHTYGSGGILHLNGDYSGGLTLSGANLGGVQEVDFNGAFSYSVSVVGTIGQTGGNGFVDFKSNVSAGHSVFLDLTQSTAGLLDVNQIGAGDLTVKFAGNFSSSDRIDGSQGTGATTVELDGDYSAGLNFVVVGDKTLNHVATLKLDDGFSYKLAMDEDNGGTTLTVDATALTAGHTLTFDASEAGSAVAVTGGAGDDTVKFGSNFAAADTFSGGAGNDTLSLNGDYAAGYTFGAAQLTSVESIVVAAVHTYGLTMNDANVASGATMTIDASALGSSDQLFFDGTAETDGHFAIISGAGADVLEGGKLSDTFDLSVSNGAFVSGFDGNDTFTVTTAASLLADFIDGGAGTDTLVLNGNFSTQTTITAANVENIEALTLLGGTNSYNLVLDGGGVEGTGTFTIDGSAAAAVTLDLTNADTRTYAITASGGADAIKFGTSFLASDTIDGGAGNDTLTLSGGDDILFGATTLTSIETLLLTGGSFDISTNDGNVGAGKTLTVDATALTTAQALTFNGAAEQDGNFVFKFGANFTASDAIAGGAGSDTLSFNGVYSSLSLSGTAISSVETLEFLNHLTTNVSITGDIADGNTLTVNSSSGRFTLDLSAATSSAYVINTANGASGSVTFGSNFTAADIIHDSGNAGNLILNGDYSAGLTLSDTKVSGMHNVSFGGAFSYAISVVGNIGSHLSLTSNVTAGHTMSLDMSQATGGDFQIFQSGAGALTTKFAGNFSGGDLIAGGTLELDGDYSSGLTFQTFGGGSKTLINVHKLQLDDGFSYKFTMNEDNAGTALSVDASALTVGHTLTFDASGDSSSLAITGGAGNDLIKFAGNFTAADAVDGGAGSDALELNGDYSAGLTFGASTIANIETLKLDNGFSYKFTTNDGNVATGATMTVDASALTGANALTFDASAENGGFFAVTGGAGDDSVTFGSHYSVSDTFNGGAGNDTLTLNNVFGTYNFTDTTIQNVEDLIITVSDGSNGSFKTTDANVAAGATMTVDLSHSGAAIGVGITFDGSAEQDGHFNFIAPDYVGTNPLNLTGGAQSDTFEFDHSEESHGIFLNGLGGDDTLTTTADFNIFSFDGGSGTDTVALVGGGTVSSAQFTLTSVENMTLDDHTWNVATSASTIAAGATLTVDATALSGSHTLTFNASLMTTASASFAFEFAGNFTASDKITGGAGSDTLSLNGDYSGGVTFGASTLVGIENIVVATGHNYTLVSNDATVASGATLTVDGSALNSSFALSFDGGFETDGHFAFISGAGTDVLQGGSQSDTFDLSRTTTANAFGGGGNDTFTVTSAAMIANGLIDGGTGINTLILNGDFSTQRAITASNVENIEALQLLGATHSYNLTFADAITTALTVDASAAASLTFDASGDTTTTFAITGSGGDDSVTMTARTVFAGSTIDGGAGTDTLTLNYASGTNVALAANTIQNLETIDFLGGTQNYSFTEADGNVASGKTLTLDATAMTAHGLFWTATAETDGFFAIKGAIGADSVTLGSETVLAGSTIDLGVGNDSLTLNGDFSTAFTFTAAEMTNVESLTLGRNHNYNLTTVDGNVAAGATLTVNGLALVSTDTITFNGAAETDGKLILEGGQGTDTLIGGAGNDTLWGYVGADTMTGGAGADTFFYTFAVGSGVAESTSTHYDTITDINFSVDKIDGPGDLAHNGPYAIDTAIAGGALSTASFDVDLANDVNGTNLAVGHAVLFTADSGSLSGHTFLIVDENGVAGYQASADLVIDVTGYAGTLTTGSFI